jgi:hypothetical protein
MKCLDSIRFTNNKLSLKHRFPIQLKVNYMHYTANWVHYAMTQFYYIKFNELYREMGPLHIDSFHMWWIGI